jgi:signal transduction histidine kinase
MSAGGRLTIACRSKPKVLVDFAAPGYRETTAEPCASSSLVLDPHATDIEIVFSDTGKGIPAEQLEALFMPFHTTKPKGMGLGLALTHKIIEEHCGHIHVTSKVAHGTVMTVTLPASLDCLTHSA